MKYERDVKEVSKKEKIKVKRRKEKLQKKKGERRWGAPKMLAFLFPK